MSGIANFGFRIADYKLEAQARGEWPISSRLRFGLFLLTTAIVCCTGCASIGPAKLIVQTKPAVVKQTPVKQESEAKPRPVEPVAPISKERREEIVREFESRRDKAQLEAAFDRWKQGDVTGCESLLLQLVGRSPTHRDARQALADLYAAKPDPMAAMDQLKLLLEQDGSDAQAHHSLGLLFESLGRRNEALAHLEQAVRLNATNELYALSLEACRGE